VNALLVARNEISAPVAAFKVFADTLIALTGALQQHSENAKEMRGTNAEIAPPRMMPEKLSGSGKNSNNSGNSVINSAAIFEPLLKFHSHRCS